MNKDSIRYIIWGLIFVVLQIVLIRHLRVFETEADIVWPFLLWIAAFHNRTQTIVIAAIIALFQDALLDLWGLNLFTKVLVMFIIYGFVPQSSENKLLSFQVFIIIFISALIHNGILVIISSNVGVYASDLFFWQTIIGNSIYTSIAGTFIYLFSSNTSVSS